MKHLLIYTIVISLNVVALADTIIIPGEYKPYDDSSKTTRLFETIEYAQIELLNGNGIDVEHLSSYRSMFVRTRGWRDFYLDKNDTLFVLEPIVPPYQSLVWTNHKAVYYECDEIPIQDNTSFRMKSVSYPINVLANEPKLKKMIDVWDIKSICSQPNDLVGAPDFILTRCVVKDSVVSEIECHIIAHPYNWYTPPSVSNTGF